MKDYLFIILGLMIATIGLAFAFAIQDKEALSHLIQYGNWSLLLFAYPYLITGVIIFIGGLAIAVTGELYRRRLERREFLICPSCGKTLRKSDKFCPQCGNEIKISES